MRLALIVALCVSLAGCTFDNLMRAISETDFKGTSTKAKEDDE